MEFDLAQTDALLSTTRAVRKRLDFDREVSDDVLLECLRLAVQAPTGSNRQGWRWLIVRDQEKKTALAEIYRRHGADYFASATQGIDEASQTGRVLDSASYLAENMEKAPVLLIPCIIGRLESHDAGSVGGMYGSIVPAIWSFQLALRSRGLGSCYTTIHLHGEADAAALLGIPDHVTQAAMLPVAWTKGTDFKPAARPPVEEITYVDGWKNTIA